MPTEHSESDDVARDDLTEEPPVEWKNHEVVTDSSIRVFYMAGNEECFGVRSIVNETGTEIQIGIVEGMLPDSPDVCTLEARNASLLVETDEPIDERNIVPLTDPELDS